MRKLSAEQAVDKERLITSQDAVYKQQLSTLKDTVEHLKERVAAHEKAIKEAEERADRMVEDHQRQLTAVTKDAEARMQEVVAIKSEYSALIETERSVSEGRIQALRQQHETDLATSKASTSQHNELILEAATSKTAKYVEDLESDLAQAREGQKKGRRNLWVG